MDWLKANYGGKQVIETEHALNSVPCNFDIITCKNLGDPHQATMEGKIKPVKIQLIVHHLRIITKIV